MGRVGQQGTGLVFRLHEGTGSSAHQDTPAGIDPENLEALVMTARWAVSMTSPASRGSPPSSRPSRSRSERHRVAGYLQDRAKRADAALRAGGAADAEGHPISFGREITRSPDSARPTLAVLYDRLGVPEVATVISLLG